MHVPARFAPLLHRAGELIVYAAAAILALSILSGFAALALHLGGWAVANSMLWNT